MLRYFLTGCLLLAARPTPVLAQRCASRVVRNSVDVVEVIDRPLFVATYVPFAITVPSYSVGYNAQAYQAFQQAYASAYAGPTSPTTLGGYGNTPSALAAPCPHAMATGVAAATAVPASPIAQATAVAPCETRLAECNTKLSKLEQELQLLKQAVQPKATTTPATGAPTAVSPPPQAAEAVKVGAPASPVFNVFANKCAMCHSALTAEKGGKLVLLDNAGVLPLTPEQVNKVITFTYSQKMPKRGKGMSDADFARLALTPEDFNAIMEWASVAIQPKR